MTALAAIGPFLAALNERYSTSYELDFLDPARNASFRVRPSSVFGLMEADFSGSPTRWAFPPVDGT